jgi:hypothetical protein
MRFKDTDSISCCGLASSCWRKIAYHKLRSWVYRLRVSCDIACLQRLSRDPLAHQENRTLGSGPAEVWRASFWAYPLQKHSC